MARPAAGGERPRSQVKRRRSLRTNLFAATVLVVVLSVGLMLAIGSVLTRRAVEDATLKDVAHQADLLAARERAAVAPGAPRKDVKSVLRAQHEAEFFPPLNRPSRYLPEDRRQDVQRGIPVDGTLHLNRTDYFFAARKVARNLGLVLIRPKSRGTTAFYPFLVGLLIAAGAGISLAALAAFVLARRIARPVSRVAEAARQLAEERQPARVPVQGAVEIAGLAEAFNEMAEQLAKARAAERQFLLSVSHELKTPLTAIRGYAEGVADGAFGGDEAAETIASEAVRLERLVRDLLDLARMNRTDFSIHREPLDLAEIAREAVRRYETQARGFGVTLESVAPAPAPAIGDPDRVLQVTSNLVENALRLTPRGGVVRVVAGRGTIEVEDTGPGLQQEDIARAFDRFYLHARYASDRSVGTGLGLSIVKQLAEGMGGSVEVETLPGRGTRFTVRLPSAGFTDGLRAANEELTQQADDTSAETDQEVLR
jgi:two-component system, OmpR family, sensor kinase